MPKEILLTHARRYPAMEPRDAVKLLYQSEFGGGHMILNEDTCMEYLRREYAATPQTVSVMLEEIGSGMVRVHLAGLDANGYSIEQLGQDFIRSAAATDGRMDVFLEKLTVLTELTQQGKMPFSPAELDDYLAGYAAAGYPAVSHSEIYRNTYHPAYRVLLKNHLPAHIQKQA